MMFEVIAIGFVLLTLRMWIQLLNQRRHDSVLFNFCDIRRDVLNYLRKNFDTISKEEYRSLRDTLDKMNNTIHYFDKYKSLVFNVREIKEMIRRFYSTIERVQEMKKNKNEEIKTMLLRYEHASLIGLVRFSPFATTRLITFLFIILIKLALMFTAKIGLESISKAMRRLYFVLTDIDKRRNEFRLAATFGH